MTTAPWLQQYLEDRGLWDTDGCTRAARCRCCRICREYVLIGLNADRCAFPVAVDPDPLSHLGEAAALIAERATYSLRFLSGRLELDYRTHFEIRGEASRDDLRLDVLATHVCGQPSLGRAPGLGTASRIAPAVVSDSAIEPPF